MKVYFACAIVGGRQDEGVYQRFVEAILAGGHEVPTAMNAGPGWAQMEGSPDPNEVYRRDTAWIDESRALVAEITTPSHGVGYEISYALERGKPVLCLYRRGARVSKMLTGNTMPGLQVAEYGEVEKGVDIIREFIQQIEAQWFTN
ncbi:MAG TPA: nucleoside 2-deoxyribosyltransferase [Anaerolineales bacterium]|nr:nucleoside 2-deoxyribosyltransferase [Anaerolineales bacterium]HLE73680.1 nucleoside 2-deoxyribosyltransferase [Anaerolineales bacterium]